MADLIFPEHAWQAMARDSISEEDVYHVVEDADDVVERGDGRTVYTGMVENGREIVVVVEDDETVVTVWEWKRRRPRRR